MPDPTFLLADTNIKGHESHGVRYFVIESWLHWEQKYAHAIRNRNFPGKTLVLDTGSALLRRLERHLASDNIALSGYAEWNAYRGHAIKLADDLNEARNPRGEHPGYHICVLMHQKAVTDEKGNVIEYLPDMSSKLDRSFAGLFDAHFCTSIETIQPTPEVDEKGKLTGNTTGGGNRYWLHSVPPTPQHHCGDNLGGAGKKYAKLPNKLENTFPALLKAWGAESEG